MTKDEKDERVRVRTPGFKVPGMVMGEQVSSAMFAIDERLGDDSWRIREASEFPMPDGSGTFVPMERLLWPAAGMPLNYVDESGLFSDLIEFFRRHISLRDLNAYEITAAFTFLTYRMDEFSICPYLNILGPKGTGKTRLMELLAAVCFRGWLVTNPSPAAVFFAVDRYRPSLFSDNYEFWSRESRRELDGLFNAGYRAGAVVPRRPKDENGRNQLEVYRVFSAKVISGTREPSEALASRCIRIRTARATEPVPMFVDGETAAQLRRKLLAYRFKHFQAPLPIDHSLMNRYWRIGEIFHPILTVAPNDETAKRIADFALGIYREDLEEDATSMDADVVKAIVDAESLTVGGKLTITHILDRFNDGRVENEKINGRRLGWALKRLGFRKTRIGDAASRGIELDKGLLEHLQRTYNPDITGIHTVSDINVERAEAIPSSPPHPPKTSETSETAVTTVANNKGAACHA
jgi:hypothetical protein